MFDLLERCFRVVDGFAFTVVDVLLKPIDVVFEVADVVLVVGLGKELLVLLDQVVGLADPVVESLQPSFQRCDIAVGGSLRLRQHPSDVFEVDGDFGQLVGLQAQCGSSPSHLSRVRDWMLPVVADPGLDAPARLRERTVGFLSRLAGVVKRLPESGNIRGSAALQGGVDLPGIAAGEHDQHAPAHVAQIHYTSRNTFALLSSVAENESATRCVFGRRR